MNQAEFAQLVKAHLSWLRGKAKQLTGSVADADDLCQETLARAWKYRDSYQEIGKPGGWLAACMYRCFCNDWAKRKKERTDQNRRETCEDFTETQAEVTTLIDGSLSDRTYAALMSLCEEYREAVVAVYIHDQSATEAAKNLGLPRGTILSRAHRGRKAMRRALESA